MHPEVLGDASQPPPIPLTRFSHLLPVKAIIEHEMKNGIPPNRIILGGFSQVSSSTPAAPGRAVCV